MTPYDINAMRRHEGDWGRPDWQDNPEVKPHPLVEFARTLLVWIASGTLIWNAYTLPATPDATSPASASSTASEGVGAVNRVVLVDYSQGSPQ